MNDTGNLYITLVDEVLEKCQDLPLNCDRNRRLISEKIVEAMAQGVVHQLEIENSKGGMEK
jgi:hypothetical protein